MKHTDVNLSVECDCGSMLCKTVGDKFTMICWNCAKIYQIKKVDYLLGTCEVESYEPIRFTDGQNF